jgi:iron complex transport system substrate-binding protein
MSKQKKQLLFIISLLVVFILGGNFSFSQEKEKLRIISLTPATTEILFALGLDKEIIAVTSLCNYPALARQKEKIGTFSQPNIEKILFLKPDIIFCTGLEQARTVIKLKQLKQNIFISDPANINELFQSIMQIGKITRKEQEAKDLVDRMKARINKITALAIKVPKEKKQKVFIEIWHNPLTACGKNSFINELIELAGGINITSDITSIYSSVSQEIVLNRNPDCIILAYMGLASSIEQVKTRPGWRNITAVRNNRVYNDISPDVLLRAGPRTPEALEEIYKRLYN